jgi:site-specific DNA recombinase
MPVSAAAIYARISSDQDGTALGVTRQLEDCRRRAQELGWAIGEEYVDNNVSAYGDRRRPEYTRLLTDITEGLRDAVILYAPDRLSRKPVEIEHFLEVLAAAKIRHLQFVTTGDIDITNGDGLMVLRVLSAVAANESTTKSRRVRRKMDQRAELGLPHGGYRRPFGYEDDKVTVRLNEANVIREVVERFVAGESLRSLARWADGQDIRTVGGGPWRSSTLRTLLASGRIAGLREHRGEVVGAAKWRAIISPSQRERVLRRLTQLETARRRAPRRYLLSGLAHCGRCGGTLYSSPRTRTRRYVCLSGPDHGGCGRISVTAEPLEKLVTDAVLFRLDTPELAAALSGRAAENADATALADALADDRARLIEVARMYGEKEIDGRQWQAARTPIELRIRAVERQLATAANSDAIVGLSGNGVSLRARWESLDLTRQAAIVRAVLDHAVVLPGVRGAQTLDPGRVQPIWRL